jgi:hypothetical protein
MPLVAQMVVPTTLAVACTRSFTTVSHLRSENGRPKTHWSVFREFRGFITWGNALIVFTNYNNNDTNPCMEHHTYASSSYYSHSDMHYGKSHSVTHHHPYACEKKCDHKVSCTQELYIYLNMIIAHIHPDPSDTSSLIE